jgi:AraC-like DNA-binding protein
MLFNDPLAFEQYLAPAGGDVRIRPMVGSRFRADISIRLLRRVGLFRVEAESFSARKAPQTDFYGLSIPLNVPFTVAEPGYDQTFTGTNAHLLSPGRSFDFRCRKRCRSMVCNFFAAPLDAYRERMLQETVSHQSLLEPRVSLVTATGSRLFRNVARAWVTLGMDESVVSEMVHQELEDDLLASFLLLAEDPRAIDREALSAADWALNRVEDYICANLDKTITRDELADTAGVSIRSLTRAFEKQYGSGPMAFVRQRRLDACYTKLVGSEPESTTVSDVAMSYGFSHFGKFAIAYKKSFGESPSASLRK